MKAACMILLVAGTGWAQSHSETCCKCGRDVSEKSAEVVCLSPKEMRSHVVHIEPLKPSGLGKGLKLAGMVVLEVRFGPDGKVVCSQAKSGHPIAISAALEAIPKWIFRSVVSAGSLKAGCGRLTIKYRLRDEGSSTELQ